jgi:hypothetical protein
MAREITNTSCTGQRRGGLLCQFLNRSVPDTVRIPADPGGQHTPRGS